MWQLPGKVQRFFNQLPAKELTVFLADQVMEPLKQNGHDATQFVRRWMSDATEEKLDRLKMIASEGRRVDDTLQTPGWAIIERHLIDAQGHAKEIAADPNNPDSVRYRSACEQRALGGHLVLIKRLVSRGEKAQEKVEKLV